MNVLYLMDPFVDFDEKFDDRSFVAKTDLNALALAKNIVSKSIRVSYAAISTILDKRDLRKELARANVNIVSFEKKEIEGIINNFNTTHNAILLKKASGDCQKKIKQYLQAKLNGVHPDIVVYWEALSDSFKEIFPEAVFLEGSHTGFWTIEGNSDILYRVYKGKDELTRFNRNSLLTLDLTPEEINEVENFRVFFKEHVVLETQLTRKALDPTGRFKSFVLYPGNFASSRFKAYANVASNNNIVSLLLEKLPEDCAILYSPHHLDKTSAYPPRCLHERVIDLSRFKQADPNISIRAMQISDAVVNVYSNIFMPAMVLGVPVFSIGNSPNAQFSLGDLDELAKWLSSEQRLVPEWYKKLEKNTLNYIFTRKINSSLTMTARGSLLYLKEIANNIHKGTTQYDCLPVVSTVSGYLNQFRQNLLFKNAFVDSYKPTNYDVLLATLLSPEIKAVGFDVFDTLLCRPFLKPTDLFDLMEDTAETIIGRKSINFANSRVAAEAIARHGKIETTFEEIYSVLEEQLQLTREQKEKLQALEISLESRFLKPRESVKNIFRLAKLLRKRVFIASDMYLSKEIITSFLRENGYDLSNVDVFVSCEVNSAKYDGSLYRMLEREHGIIPCETLFIGDNLKSDIAIPSELGFATMQIPKAIDVFSNNRLFSGNVLKFLKDTTFGFHWGYLANKLFDNPFVRFERDQVVNNSASMLGYMIFGPLVLSITQWLAENLKGKRYDSILFSSRDSRVIIDVYRYWKEKISPDLPGAQYIHISRTATLPAYCDREHLLTLLSLYQSRLSTGDFLEKVFDIDVKDRKVRQKLSFYKIDVDQENRRNFSRLPAFLIDYFDSDSSLKEKIKGIHDYFSSMIEGKKVACFDLGSKGTSRDILADIFKVDIDLYLFRTIRYKWKNNLTAYMQDSINPYRHGVRSVLPQFYELLLSDPLVKTCQGYEVSNGKVIPKVEPSDFTNSSLHVIESQRYTRDFCQEFMDLFGNYSSCINSQSRTSFIYPLSFLCANVSDQKLLNIFEGDDPFWSKDKISVIGQSQKVPSVSSVNKPTKDNGSKLEISANLALLNKLNRSPEEYFRDSRVPFLQFVYKITQVPLVGPLMLRVATKITKSVIIRN